MIKLDGIDLFITISTSRSLLVYLITTCTCKNKVFSFASCHKAKKLSKKLRARRNRHPFINYDYINSWLLLEILTKLTCIIRKLSLKHNKMMWWQTKELTPSKLKLNKLKLNRILCSQSSNVNNFVMFRRKIGRGGWKD